MTYDGPDKHGLTFCALHPIASGEEVVVSYIDATYPRHARQRELQDRYFFTCECSKCLDEIAVESQDIPKSLHAEGHLAIEQRAFDLLAAAQKDTSISGPIQKLKYGIHILRKIDSWPLYRQPLAALRQHLVVSLIAAGQLHYAFLHAWIQYYRIDINIYPEDYHPIRLLHMWLLIVLLKRIEDIPRGAEDLPPQTHNISIHLLRLDRLFTYLLDRLFQKVRKSGFHAFYTLAKGVFMNHIWIESKDMSREEFLHESRKLTAPINELLQEELVWDEARS